MSIPRPRNWQKGAGCTGQLPGLGHSRLIFCRLNRPGGNLTIEATTIKRTRPRSPCFVPTPWPTGRRSSLFLTSSKPCFGTLGAQWLKWLNGSIISCIIMLYHALLFLCQQCRKTIESVQFHCTLDGAGAVASWRYRKNLCRRGHGTGETRGGRKRGISGAPWQSLWLLWGKRGKTIVHYRSL